MGIISQISPADFEEKFLGFPRDYMLDFNVFWRWRLRVEGGGGHILDRRSLGKAHRRLVRVLVRWQAYSVKGLKHKWRDTLRRVLGDISDAYDEVRGCSLLEFNRVSEDALRRIWDGLCEGGGWFAVEGG